MNIKTVLSKSELLVLQLVALGYSSKKIAGEIGITSKTVENHRGSIAKKLGLSGNNCVMRFALTNKKKLLSTSPSLIILT